jgi:hypothetical protein
LRAYARFFATPRSLEQEVPALLPLEAFTPEEQVEYRALETELLGLRSSVDGDPAEEEKASNRSWLFGDAGNVTIVCAELPDKQKGPLAKPSDPNYTDLQRYADLDALTELFGHIRAENPQIDVHFKLPNEVVPDDLSGHVVLLGGVVWNQLAGRISEMARLPIRQFAHPELLSGEIFIVDTDGQEIPFWPVWENDGHTLLAEDVGLLARVPNPLNSNRTLTICNGIHSRGVYGAVRSLSDSQLRDDNERYIAENFGQSDSFAILMSVKVIKDIVTTPDFNSAGVVLYQWSQGPAE